MMFDGIYIYIYIITMDLNNGPYIGVQNRFYESNPIGS